MPQNLQELPILIITPQADLARRDRLCLIKLGFQKVHTFSSASEALEFLRQTSAGLVLCEYELGDKLAPELIKEMRKGALSRQVPAVLLTVERRREQVLDAITAGCAGYVLRPYSGETLERHLSVAAEAASYGEIETEQLNGARAMVESGSFDEAISEYEEIVSIADEARRYFEMGMEHLMRQQYGKAIIAFNKAVRINDMFAEAFKGLADAHKGKGDTAKAQECLTKAADIYAMQDRFQETKEIFAELLKNDASSMNPFNSLGVKLRRQGDYLGAIHAYNQALELTPKDENLRYNLAKALSLAGQHDQAIHQIREALGISPGFPEAAELYRRLSGQAWLGPTRPSKGSAASKGKLIMDE